MRSGLATGARILRRCRNSSRIGAIHPWRRLLARILFLPLFVGALLLWYFGRLCEWLSNLSGLVDEFVDWWRYFVESKREIEIHRRAWRMRIGAEIRAIQRRANERRAHKEAME